MDVKITPARLCGAVRALPSKSEAHRALILAALADKPTAMCLGDGAAALSDDILRTAKALEALGASVGIYGGGILVTPPVKYAESAVIDCGESGSTLRFMIPVCAALGGEFRFIRRGRLPKRPIAALTDALAAHGVSFAEDGDDLLMSGRLTPGSFTVAGNESSQFITGILLALTVCGGSLRVIGELESAPYVDITLDMMNRFGVPVFCVEKSGETSFSVLSCERRLEDGGTPREIAIGGDWSGAANFLAIGGDWSGAANFLAVGASVTGLDPDSAQGDRAIIDILAAMGADIRTDNGAIAASFAGKPRAINVDMRDTPDLVPLVAALCAAADGTSVLRGTRRLRLKESDRVASTLALLRSLGANAEATEDAITVAGGDLHGGEVDSFGDHRIAMAAAAASCFIAERADHFPERGDIVVRGAECVKKSYPGFWETFRSLGGKYTDI